MIIRMILMVASAALMVCVISTFEGLTIYEGYEITWSMMIGFGRGEDPGLSTVTQNSVLAIMAVQTLGLAALIFDVFEIFSGRKKAKKDERDPMTDFRDPMVRGFRDPMTNHTNHACVIK